MTTDSPNRLPWPPMIYGGLVIAGLLLARTPLALPITGGTAVWLTGLTLLAAGLCLDVWAMASMARHRTNILPHRPAGKLLTSGPFALARNPIYLGNTIAMTGLALVVSNGWLLLLAGLAAGLTHFLAILREERHLQAKFGADWDAYSARVRRWGLI